MQEGLKILVVGDDTGHDISAVTNTYTGWTPQIVRMSDDEWKLPCVGEYLDCLASVCMSAGPAEQRLLEEGRYPISSNSQFLFHLYEIYTQLGATANVDLAEQLTARQIINTYLHNEANPLVAVVLSNEAFGWPQTGRTWLDQLLPGTAIWRMHASGQLVRAAYGSVEVQA